MKYLFTFSLFFIIINRGEATSATYISTVGDSTLSLDKEELEWSTFLTLTPQQITRQTGKRLSLKQVWVLKRAQKKLKKQRKNALKGNPSGKKQITAILLAMFLGIIGVHRFYLGYTAYGVLLLLTFGGCFFLALLDLILITTGELQPKYGAYIDDLD